jgi:hypothetical protein
MKLQPMLGLPFKLEHLFLGNSFEDITVYTNDTNPPNAKGTYLYEIQSTPPVTGKYKLKIPTTSDGDVYTEDIALSTTEDEIL